MPSLLRMHASGSHTPVTTAILGRSPSLRLRGSRNVPSGIAVSVHAVTWGTVSLRRHLPVVITTGTLVPGGMPSSRKLPCASVRVLACAPPGSASLQRAHVTPTGKGPGSVIGA